MTLLVILQRITGPYIISILLSKWSNQVPKQSAVKHSLSYSCAINQTSEH